MPAVNVKVNARPVLPSAQVVVKQLVVELVLLGPLALPSAQKPLHQVLPPLFPMPVIMLPVRWSRLPAKSLVTRRPSCSPL